MRLKSFAEIAALLATLALPALAADRPKPHNVLIFVADGLRYDSVTAETAPALWKIKHEGVDFTNSHSLYPTITTVNASAIATGHSIGDTGNFGNALYSGFPTDEDGGIAILENDKTLGEMNAHFGGNYLNETSLMAAARQAGFATAVMGKVGPTAIQDVTQRDGSGTIVIDDAFNTPAGIPVAPDILDAIKAAELASNAPKAGAPNTGQQKYMVAIATRVVLLRLVHSGKPFAMLFWSRDPDYSQHVSNDGPGKLSPGINGPTGKAGIKDADETFAALLAALKAQGLDRTTDIFVTADHGFSTVAKHSATSASARYEAAGGPLSAVDTRNAPPPVQDQELPSGFFAVDLADALNLPLTDAHTQKPVNYAAGETLGHGDGLIGTDPKKPFAIVISNGGSEHIWLTGDGRSERARQIVHALMAEDYVSGIFVDDALGPVPGTLPMSAINLRGAALTPQPSIIVNLRSFAVPGCTPLLLCAAEVADTSLSTGQGMHGTFSRADTRNFMAAIGPDFRHGFSDPAPVSNADITPTLAHLLGLTITPKGHLTGRIASEALTGGRPVRSERHHLAGPPSEGLATLLDYQTVGDTRYFDAAGFAGRTVGLSVCAARQGAVRLPVQRK